MALRYNNSPKQSRNPPDVLPGQPIRTGLTKVGMPGEEQYAAQAVVHQWLESFNEFPPRQKAASFTIDQIVERLMPAS